MDKQKILIVDDSEMNRALLIDILEEHYDVERLRMVWKQFLSFQSKEQISPFCFWTL